VPNQYSRLKERLMSAPVLLDSDELTAEIAPGAEEGVEAGGPVLAELLVEEISIDGMCGVY
jgi:mycofactocin precursor